MPGNRMTSRIRRSPRARIPESSVLEPPGSGDTGTGQSTRERILRAATDEFADKGLAGGRLDAICAIAQANIRMIYHYFGDKAGLYVAVLEQALSGLRREELKLRIDHPVPLEALMQLFDFIYDHFGTHPQLISLLSGENLLKAEFLKKSSRTPVISSPVLSVVRRLLARGEADGSVRPGLDPLQLYVLMVSLSYFHLSNGHTLSVIFEVDVYRLDWLADHKQMARDAVRRLVIAQPAT